MRRNTEGGLTGGGGGVPAGGGLGHCLGRGGGVARGDGLQDRGKAGQCHFSGAFRVAASQVTSRARQGYAAGLILTWATVDAEAVPPEEEAVAWPLAWALLWSSLRSAGLGREE